MTDPELNTTPSFVYEQLDTDDMMIESPIEVIYWNGSIELRQRNNGCVLILDEDIKKLFKAVMKHYPESQRVLKK